MKKKRNKKLWISLGLIGLITSLIIIWGGINMFKQGSQEEIRNREHEVSLVKALKNTYAGLKEIEMSGAIYSDPPGSWSTGVKLVFEDGEKVSYRIGHSLAYSENASAITSDENISILQKHYGITETKVTVIYSDDRKEVE